MADELSNPALTPIYSLLGLLLVKELGAAIVGGVKWLAHRTVAKEDEEKKAHEKRLADLEEELREHGPQVASLAQQVDGCVKTLSGISAAVGELRANLDTRLSGQADFYRASVKEFAADVEKKLEALEFRIRQDTSRALADHLSSKRKR